MRTLVITEHPEFGKVRTVEAGGRVWFCARDVASALGYANPKDAVNRHCRPKGVCVHDLLTAGGRQKVKFIDEGNLYRLMACSRLPSAERFESWIFDELVPRTLKEGGYLLEKEGETDAELLSRTLQLAEAKLKERDRYISGLEKENALNALKLSLQAPKVRYFDEVLHSPSTYTVTQIAKELGMKTIQIRKGIAVYANLSCGAEVPDFTVDSLSEILSIPCLIEELL
jgi:prophage antirepressor-like protein